MPAQAHLRVARQAGVQRAQRRPEPALQLGCEGTGVLCQVQARVGAIALGLEIGRQVLVGIAVAVGADDPDLLGTQALAQPRQNAEFGVDHVHSAARIDDELVPTFGDGV